MGYVYAGLWLLIAVMLFFRFRKEGKVIIAVSLYFLFLSIWWLANQLIQVDLMSGIYIWILRAVSALVLLMCMVIYMKQKNNNHASSGNDE